MSVGLPVPVGWFGRSPLTGHGQPKSGLAAALWRLDRDAPWEFRGEPVPGTHMICVHLSGSIGWEARLDDRRYTSPCLPGTSCLVRAGESGDVVARDAHASFIHFYLPTPWFAGCVEEFAPGQRVEEVELLDPMNARTCTAALYPQHGRCARAALRRGWRSRRPACCSLRR